MKCFSKVLGYVPVTIRGLLSITLGFSSFKVVSSRGRSLPFSAFDIVLYLRDVFVCAPRSRHFPANVDS